jgi:hypothetical protein
MSFNKKLSTILEARLLRPAIITMKRGTVIEADHVRMIKTPAGKTILVVGIGPGRFDVECPSNNPTHVVGKLRDFYAPSYYVPSKGQDPDTGIDLEGTCESCQRHYTECMRDPCADPKYYYDLHRILVKIQLFKKILTMRPNNIASIRE